MIKFMQIPYVGAMNSPKIHHIRDSQFTLNRIIRLKNKQNLNSILQHEVDNFQKYVKTGRNEQYLSTFIPFLNGLTLLLMKFMTWKAVCYNLSVWFQLRQEQ